MPIRLGDQDSGGPGPSWNPYVLVILWLLQFGTLAFLELYLGIYVLILGAFGGAGLMYVPINTLLSPTHPSPAHSIPPIRTL